MQETTASSAAPAEPDVDARPASVIALGASAGGVDAIRSVITSLPSDIDAAVLVVLHISPRGPSVLPEIIERASRLRAHHAVDGEPLRQGNVYVAPPDRHLVLVRDTLHVTDGPRENGVRPAVDVLFRSVARSYGDRTLAVVLSGMLDDGTAGAREVKRCAGTVLVQDPDDAMFPAMPTSAVLHAHPDYVRRSSELGPLLAELTEQLGREGRRGADVTMETGTAEVPTEFTCPDCGGTLFHDDGRPGALHFQCRVGHAYSPESLMVGKEEALEAALWAAVVALEERGDLSRRLSRRMSHAGSGVADRYYRQARETEEQAMVLRDLLASIKLRDDPERSP